MAGSPALEDAVTAGLARTLQPGDVFEDRMWGVLYHGVDGVGDLRADGNVAPAEDPFR